MADHAEGRRRPDLPAQASDKAREAVAKKRKRTGRNPFGKLDAKTMG